LLRHAIIAITVPVNPLKHSVCNIECVNVLHDAPPLVVMGAWDRFSGEQYFLLQSPTENKVDFKISNIQ